MKENLKPCVYKLWKYQRIQPRTFCRTVRRVAAAGEVKVLSTGAEGKPSLNWAVKSAGADPKSGDLSMSSMKLP